MSSFNIDDNAQTFALCGFIASIVMIAIVFVPAALIAVCGAVLYGISIAIYFVVFGCAYGVITLFKSIFDIFQ